jgi:hypothetical protein
VSLASRSSKGERWARRSPECRDGKASGAPRHPGISPVVWAWLEAVDRVVGHYAFHNITVTHCGRICFKGRKVNLSHVFAGQNVGVTQVGERIWLVTFMHYDLGYFDDETCRLEPIENPFGPKVLPLRSE